MNLREMMLGVAFAALWAFIVAMTWQRLGSLEIPVGAAILLFPTCLVTLLMWRRYRGR